MSTIFGPILTSQASFMLQVIRQTHQCFLVIRLHESLPHLNSTTTSSLHTQQIYRILSFSQPTFIELQNSLNTVKHKKHNLLFK
jgi:hypothetical protein